MICETYPAGAVQVNNQELLASANADSGDPVFSAGELRVDLLHRQVTVGGQEVHLTPNEFRLLTVFVRNRNQVLSQDQLLELVWGGTRGSAREQVKLYVGYLRRKLGADAAGESPIETRRGFGYCYRAAR